MVARGIFSDDGGALRVGVEERATWRGLVFCHVYEPREWYDMDTKGCTTVNASEPGGAGAA